MAEPFVVRQHDRAAIADAVTAITGEPAEVGDTYLAFLATLTPATSGGVQFELHGDGLVESMYATCPACGRATSTKRTWASTAEEFRALARLAAGVRAGVVSRVRRRVFGCRTCTPDAICAAAA